LGIETEDRACGSAEAVDADGVGHPNHRQRLDFIPGVCLNTRNARPLPGCHERQPAGGARRNSVFFSTTGV